MRVNGVQRPARCRKGCMEWSSGSDNCLTWSATMLRFSHASFLMPNSPRGKHVSSPLLSNQPLTQPRPSISIKAFFYSVNNI